MKSQRDLGEIHQELSEIYQNFGGFGDSRVLWGAPNAGKCKMTHYYWSKTTLGHLFGHPKSTPKELKKHPEPSKIDGISMKLR